MKIERHGSVPKPASIGPPALAARYAFVSRKRLRYDTAPSAKPKRFSAARPSNQWPMRLSPTSSFAGVTRMSEPVSHAGTSPCTGRRSTAVSSSWLWKPRDGSVVGTCESAVAMVDNIPSILD